MDQETHEPRRLAIIALLLGVAAVLAARGALWYQTADFFCFYSGSRALALGQDPYDPATWLALTGGLFPDPRHGLVPAPCPTQYGYPLWTAVALLPFGVLPIQIAATLWIAVSLAAAIYGARALWVAYGGTPRGAALFATLVFTSQPFWLLLISGQMSGVMLGLTGALAASIAVRRDVASGVSLALLALKPQLVALTLPTMLVRLIRDRRRIAIAAALVSGALLVIVPMLFVAWWPLEWLGDVGRRRLQVVTLLPTAWGFAADVFGNAAWGAVLCAALIAICLIIARRVDALSLLALSTSLSLVVTPYAWSYDFLVLACPWAFVLARAARTRGAPAFALRAGVVTVASLMPWVLYAVAFGRGGETLSVLVPAATAFLVAAATRMTVTTA